MGLAETLLKKMSDSPQQSDGEDTALDDALSEAYQALKDDNAEAFKESFRGVIDIALADRE